MADTNTSELKIVFTIADLASSKIDEINKKWDSMRKILGDAGADVNKLNSGLEKITSGSKMMKVGIDIAKIIKYLYDGRMESSKLENNFKTLGMTAQDVAVISNTAFKLSDDTGIPVEKILSGAFKIKSSFKELNAENLNTLVKAVANNTLATGGSFEDLTNQLIDAGISVKNFKGDINQLNFGNIKDSELALKALDNFPAQFKRASEAWKNFKIHLGKGIEDSGLIKFGILESVLTNVFKAIADGIEVINVFLINNPKLVEFAATFAMLGAAVLSGAGTFSVLKGAFIFLKAAAVPFFTFLKAAIVGNPIGLIVVGLVAAVALVITYWDEIKAATMEVVNYILEKWNSFVDFLTSAWDTVKGAWMEMPDWAKGLVAVIAAVILGPIGLFLGLFAGIGLTIYNYWDDIVQVANSIAVEIANLWGALVAGVAGFGNYLLSVLNVIWNNIAAIGPWLLQKFIDLWNMIPQSAITAGLNLMKALGRGIVAGLSFLVQPIKSALGFIGSYLPGGSKQAQGPFAKILGLKPVPNPGQNQIPVPGTQPIRVPSGSTKAASMPGMQIKVQPAKTQGLSADKSGINTNGLVATLTSKRNTTSLGNSNMQGIRSDIPKGNHVLKRFNESIDSNSTRVVRRTSEVTEMSEATSMRRQGGTNVSIGSVIGQLVVGDRMANKKKIGEIITDAIFQELDRFEEMELA
ncbi:hypothetical protein [Leptospira alstonii]|uniref:Tail tape measure protein, TIGR01760 family n=2 Tax=Leptospira alstonii TaxID=28452 RepID=M6CNT5_9LEPT|nr:hypothetical protein [Leptospira alstonii]EMJ92206.1 hypothetical protein LEP1GSC194_3494 [Leptospira alstonii serovar Sichuan str. 79601]EQA80577.1 hypothetical protein LEP1GSC193_3358 [Leptospira alstonii serovar Pingchang str. 80-412]